MFLAWLFSLIAAMSNAGHATQVNAGPTMRGYDTYGGPSLSQPVTPADTYGGPSVSQPITPADTYGGPSALDTYGGPS